jgi:hypothetical protein
MLSSERIEIPPPAQISTWKPPDKILGNLDPSLAFSLEVMKSGSIVETLNLNLKSWFVFGRQPELCDVVLVNPTASRMHAAIIHGKERGELFLYDFGSTHGTQVNMQRVKPNEYIRIYVGDLLVFGYSSRFYLVCGPSEFRSPEFDQVARNLLEESVLEKNGKDDDQFVEGENASTGNDGSSDLDDEDDSNE